jgi:hypothetical protein
MAGNTGTSHNSFYVCVCVSLNFAETLVSGPIE